MADLALGVKPPAGFSLHQAHLVQLFTDKVSSGNSAFGLLADTRVDVDGPAAQPKCGRAAVPSAQNQQAFQKFPASAWQLLGGDGFFLSNPGFAHCSGTEVTCAWKKV